ncbi:glycosyltransferase family 2 protein [Vannielia sp.]|uniref:glycosyltransferase family 2 protein n=1 Tax=Vannielia sp. TaxID=2813045 RepID=UPI0026241277|nr:glycosyltransferase family 2 protein [Vannielia sp.]MDF1871204.1 glycosyltransferase family 2 protein [Vannielia sp.]
MNKHAPQRKMVLTAMKNEGPYLLEWIAYHKMIGFTDFLIYSNDCSDGSNLMLNRLDQLGVIRHFDNPLGPRMDPQRAAYSRANKDALVREMDWLAVIDADEFLNIHVGDHSIDALVEACPPGTEAISLNWRFMGSNGHAHMAPDELVTERFTQGATLLEPENGLCWGFKTVFDPKRFGYFGVHRPKFEKKTEIVPGMRCWVNGGGERLDDKILEKGWRSNKHNVSYEFGQVNHYAIKSREEFLLKRLRGTANSKNTDRIDMGYWHKNDLNACEDSSILTDGLAEAVAELLRDDDLAALHRACLETCRRSIEYQMQDPKLAHFIETGEYEEEETDEKKEDGKKDRKKDEKAA